MGSHCYHNYAGSKPRIDPSKKAIDIGKMKDDSDWN